MDRGEDLVVLPTSVFNEHGTAQKYVEVLEAKNARLREELAAAQATIEQMREALNTGRATLINFSDSFSGTIRQMDEARHLQPCPEVLNKVRAEAVREFGKTISAQANAEGYAQRIEQGEA